MATLKYSGGEEFADKILALGEQGEAIAKHALFVGAGVVADAIKNAIAQLPTGTPKGNSPTGHPFTGLTEDDKEDLLNGLGIARFESGRDEVSTAISFAGYTRRTEDDYPGGVPLAMIARSIESGSSVRTKNPFVRPTVSKIKGKAVSEMGKTASDDIKNAMR